MRRASQVAPVVKNPPASAGDSRDTGLIPGSGRPPGEGNGNPLQFSCVETPMNRGVWQATVYEVPKSRTWLSNWIISRVLLAGEDRPEPSRSFCSSDKHSLSVGGACTSSSVLRPENPVIIFGNSGELLCWLSNSPLILPYHSSNMISVLLLNSHMQHTLHNYRKILPTSPSRSLGTTLLGLSYVLPHCFSSPISLSIYI